MKSISIVVPVFNEEENVAAFHQEIVEVCRLNQLDFEIIFVDDGSEDKTAEEIKKLADLRDMGALTDEEFQNAKTKLLAS